MLYVVEVLPTVSVSVPVPVKTLQSGKLVGKSAEFVGRIITVVVPPTVAFNRNCIGLATVLMVNAPQLLFWHLTVELGFVVE
jgi:hypothetical protein